MKNIIALFAGLLFSAGLALSGMTDTHKIIGFLDIFGDWDASLMFVMGAALMIVVPAFYFILKQKKPLFEDGFSLPINQLVDKKLMIGAIIFGSGWGLYGYCPGPAIAALTYLNIDSFGFVLAMFIGMYLSNTLNSKS